MTRLGAGLVLLELPCAAPPPAGAATLLVEGEPLAPPTAAMLLGDAAAPRLIFAARDPGERLRLGAQCRLLRGDPAEPVAAFRLGPALAPDAMLVEGRDAAEREALLRFLLGTCRTGLLRGAGEGLAPAAHALARSLRAEGAVARPLCQPGAALSLWQLPEAALSLRQLPGAAASGPWHLLSSSTVRRIAPPVAGRLILDGAPPSDALLLPPAPAAPIGFAAAGHLPSLHRLLRGALDSAGGQPLLRALSAHPAGAALLQEAQLLAPARPVRAHDPVAPVGAALELALADGAGGLFLCGWLRDPLKLVTGFELRGGAVRREVPLAVLHRVARPDLTASFAATAFGPGGPLPGFLAHLPDADHPGVAQWRLVPRLASGEAMAPLVAPPARLGSARARDLVLRAVHPRAMRPELLQDCIAPTAARLHAAALAEAAATPPELLRISAPLRRGPPRAAVIVPLWRNLRFLRAQLAAFARDPAFDRGAVEVVYVLDSPEQRGELEQLLRGIAALQGGALALTLVVMSANQGYAAACNAGAAASAAPVLAMLNSDVLPAAPGWLAPLLRRLGRDRRLGAVGPKLLFDDGTVQHAGMAFRLGLDGQWLNEHPGKGFPRHHPDVARARRVPAVTGAALVVRRAAFEAVGGFCTDYIIGDFEDSDLCLKLRAAGHEIAYEPAAELFHFERQSIADHAGHARTLAGACNRLLHHRRWDAAITALMRRFPDWG